MDHIIGRYYDPFAGTGASPILAPCPAMPTREAEEDPWLAQNLL